MTQFTRGAAVALAGVFLITNSLYSPLPAMDQENRSGLLAGRYTGACQLMIIGKNGVITYDDGSMNIGHLEITANGSLNAEFPDKKLGRGKWNDVTLNLSNTKRCAVWTRVIKNDTYKVTAIPYSSSAYVFRLEIINNGKLIAGAQQFYAICAK
jgi:hypothetical protein